MFVATSSQPDIAFAVHQCTKFNTCPRKCHEEAVKRIGRYLRRMQHKGLILKPDTTQHNLSVMQMRILRDPSAEKHHT